MTQTNLKQLIIRKVIHNPLSKSSKLNSENLRMSSISSLCYTYKHCNGKRCSLSHNKYINTSLSHGRKRSLVVDRHLDLDQ